MNRTLNEHQLALLRRIGENTDPLSSSESHLAISVYALRSRRLVSTAGQRRFWTATLTDLGRKVVELGSTQAADAAMGAKPGSGAALSRKQPTRGPLRISVEKLVAQVHDAGGELRIADPQPGERREWRRSIAASQGHAEVPSGMRITHQGRDHGDLIIRLSVVEPVPEPETRPPLVPVIERLTQPHPLVAATRSGASSSRDGWVDTMRTKGVLHMRGASQSVRRVLLITQTLILEAERRGYGVEVGSEDRRCAGGLCINIDGHQFELTFAEENDRHPHVATKTELDRAERYSWQKVPEWDYTPSGRLQLRSGHDGYKPLATDRVRWRLDDRLGHALAELEARAGEFTRRAMEEQRRLEQRQLAWEQAMERARIRLVESHRADHLRRQVDDRRHASEIRALVAAARDAAGATWAIDPKTEEWLTWASDHADEIDPLRAPIHMPEPPEATSSALQPFLDGWSPYGPETSRRL